MAINGEMTVPPELMTDVERYAVYRCYSDSGQLLYVGVTGSVRRRLGDHLQKAWFTQVRGMTFEWYADELDALNAERRAIHVEHPKYNQVHRNGSTLATRPDRPRKHREAARDTAGSRQTTRERARKLLDADPELREPGMGGELARRLGVSPQTGRRLRAELVKA